MRMNFSRCAGISKKEKYVGDGNYRLGCDIGGTFTDFVLVNDDTGEFQINKCLTTPGYPSDAVEQGIRELLEQTPRVYAQN